MIFFYIISNMSIRLEYYLTCSDSICITAPEMISHILCQAKVTILNHGINKCSELEHTGHVQFV